MEGGGTEIAFHQKPCWLYSYAQWPYFFNCLQSTLIKCLLNFIYWTPQLPAKGGEAIITSISPNFLDDLHLQIIEIISLKASAQ